MIGREFEAEVTFADTTLALEYRVIEKSESSLDLLAGARALYTNVSLDVGPLGAEPAIDEEQDKTWIDPIVGAKGRYRFNDHWGVVGEFAEWWRRRSGEGASPPRSSSAATERRSAGRSGGRRSTRPWSE